MNMTIGEAKQILRAYRPDAPDREDSEVAEALALADQHPELAQWLSETLAFQSETSEKLRELEPPPGFKDRILAARRLDEQRAWRRRLSTWAAAATLALLLALFYSITVQNQTSRPDFAGFRDRVTRTVIREYRMDLESSDPSEIAAFLTANEFTVDPMWIKRSPDTDLFGAGRLSWKGKPVAMICYKTQKEELLFLFCARSEGMAGLPEPSGEAARISHLETWSWTWHDKTYVLAGDMPPERLQEYHKENIPRP